MSELKTDTVQDRLDRLKELEEFTEKCQKQLNDVFEMLGWSPDYKQEPMEQCPFDPHHRVPVRTMERHTASCRLRSMGYTKDEQAEMIDPSACYENTSVKTFIIDKSTQHQIIQKARSAAPMMKMEGVFWQGQYSGQPVDVPQTHTRAMCDLTVADRLAVYDHVTSLSGRGDGNAGNEDLYVDLVKKLQKGDDQDEPKSHMEMLAEMRDYKRRRQSYRAKNVHITKKSYTEVIREVIKVHSGELSKQWREEEEPDRAEPTSSRRRSLSTESHRSHGNRHKRSREKSSERESKKKRKKKDRDSRSPDDHHHDRKKKKKKKKEEREKEK